MTASGYGAMRAASADRERAVDVLKAAYAEGRLTKDECDTRTAQIYAARTYGDLAALTADLPAGPLGTLPPGAFHQLARRPAKTNSTAILAFVCGLAQPFTLGLTTLPAIILGHAARRQISRTGEDGSGMATTGFVLGWMGAVLITFIVTILVVAAFAAARSGAAVHTVPVPLLRVRPPLPPGQ
jgi:uncharacterized membrane protein